MINESGKCNDPMALATRLFSQLVVGDVDGTQLMSQCLTQQHNTMNTTSSNCNNQLLEFGFSQPAAYQISTDFSTRPHGSFSQPGQAGIVSLVPNTQASTLTYSLDYIITIDTIITKTLFNSGNVQDYSIQQQPTT